jgi:hypothetical protein
VLIEISFVLLRQSLVTSSIVATIVVVWTHVMSYRKSCDLVRSAPVYAF